MPSPEILLRPLQRREALRSSSLEGTYATPDELLLFELDPREASSTRDPVNAWREVYNYNTALRQGFEAHAEQPLAWALVRQLHATLLGGVRGADRSPGQFRDDQVYIGTDHRFIPPPVTHLSECLDLLATMINSGIPGWDRLASCFIIHYQFETIHPFFDGNGRVGRLLLSIMLHKWCAFSKPWLYMSAFFDRHRDEYVDRLFAVSARGEWEPWLAFCLRGTIEQAVDTIERCQRLLSLRGEYMKRAQAVKGGSVRLAALIDTFLESPYVRVADIQRRFGITYPTAQADAKRLTDAGIIEELPRLYPKTYVARGVYEVAFAEP